jgi:hypothetical protein
MIKSSLLKLMEQMITKQEGNITIIQSKPIRLPNLEVSNFLKNYSGRLDFKNELNSMIIQNPNFKDILKSALLDGPNSNRITVNMEISERLL